MASWNVHNIMWHTSLCTLSCYVFFTLYCSIPLHTFIVLCSLTCTGSRFGVKIVHQMAIFTCRIWWPYEGWQNINVKADSEAGHLFTKCLNAVHRNLLHQRQIGLLLVHSKVMSCKSKSIVTHQDVPINTLGLDSMCDDPTEMAAHYHQRAKECSNAVTTLWHETVVSSQCSKERP